jgi:fused signal recognition particle receptor
MRITEALSKGRWQQGDRAGGGARRAAAEVGVPDPSGQALAAREATIARTSSWSVSTAPGKTTTIGKLAQRFVRRAEKVTLAAGDTFRAAAIDQLEIWGERDAGAEVVARGVGADSAGLAFDALKRARENFNEVLLIDTAGRLQNKQALMDEAREGHSRAAGRSTRKRPTVLLVLDATTGQNALNQVEVFKDKAGVTGLVMTKLDGTAKGGILVAISAKFGLPVHAIGVGEGVEDLAAFDAGEFARAVALS